MLRYVFLLILVATLVRDLHAQPAPSAAPVSGWPQGVSKVEVPCDDGVAQPAMWYAPATAEAKPLLVGLHTWSSGYASAGSDAGYAEWCLRQGWAFIHPHFRGPNMTPDAMGSERAVSDVMEAVAWAKRQTNIDPQRIYLVGVSGGGHMAMLMAGKHPETWAGVSAWCGISDLTQWYAEHLKNGQPDRYAQNIEAALGGSPTTDETRRAAAWSRSPLSCLPAALSVPLDINHGVHDGRKGSVPFTHSLRAYNAVVGKGALLDVGQMQQYYQEQRLPSGWSAAGSDEVYGKWVPLFRRTHGNTRVTIFEGGHEIVLQAALNWLSRQRQGQPAVWQLGEFIPLDAASSESGK